MNYLYLYNEPFVILLFLANMNILYSSLKTKNKIMKNLSFIVIVLFSAYHLYQNNLYYFDLWIVVIISLIFYFNIFRIRKIHNSHLIRPGKIIPQTLYERDLDEFEKTIFQKYFKNIFEEKDFKLLLDLGEKKINKGKKKLVKEGDDFDRVFFFAEIPTHKGVVIRNKHIDISYIDEGSWIDKNLNEWLIDLHLHLEGEAIIYYQWDIISLHNLLIHSTDSTFPIKLFIVWIRYLCNSIIRLDDHIANALKALIDQDKAARAVSIPIYRYLSGVRRKSSASPYKTEEVQPETQEQK